MLHPANLAGYFFALSPRSSPPHMRVAMPSHGTETISKGAHFLRFGEPAKKIVRMEHGIISGYLTSELSTEDTIHSFLEGDRVLDNFITHVAALIDLEALENTVLSVAKCEKIMGVVN